MCKAFSPPGRSFSLLYSLHGGASVVRLALPGPEVRISSSDHASSSMSCSELASRSKASKRERPCLSAAAEMGACIPAKTSKSNPPLMLGSMAAGRCVGVDSEGWSASFAGDKACVAGGLAMTWVGSAECYRLWDCTVRRSGRSGLRTVSGAVGRMLRSPVRLLAAFYSAYMRELAVVCFTEALLESAADWLALMRCRPLVARLPLYPFFWVVPP